MMTHSSLLTLICSTWLLKAIDNYCCQWLLRLIALALKIHENCLAFSLSVDGAVDKQCVGNKHVIWQNVLGLLQLAKPKKLCILASVKVKQAQRRRVRRCSSSCWKSGISWKKTVFVNIVPSYWREILGNFILSGALWQRNGRRAS